MNVLKVSFQLGCLAMFTFQENHQFEDFITHDNNMHNKKHNILFVLICKKCTKLINMNQL